ncbi:hypothetical protein [Streptomyces sp. NPDC056525]|uniref:hypothetical protein n=1 Tax=unclassified Streptomyces TaxID=2593676 RepID=UPI0036B4C01D
MDAVRRLGSDHRLAPQAAVRRRAGADHSPAGAGRQIHLRSVNMTNPIAVLAARLAGVERRLDSTSRTAQLAYSSIEDGAISVYDGDGSLRAIIGQQPDGTTGLTVTNGPPPPQPVAPTMAPSIGGVTVGWDGRLLDGSATPLDWARLEIHSAEVQFTPDASTLRATIESPQGGTFTVQAETPQYVCLVARNTSGTVSLPSPMAGPLGRLPVVAEAVLDGIVGELALADAAVSRAKIAVGAVDADRLAIGTGNLLPDGGFEGAYSEKLIADSPDWHLTGPGNNSARCLTATVTAESPTTRSQRLTVLPASPGDRFFLAVDYQTSTDWSGAGARLFLRWCDAGGATLGVDAVERTAAPGTTWTRMGGQAQAPANTVRAEVWAEAVQASQGRLSFDNGEVRTVVTAGMVLAGSIGTSELAADSVTAEKVVAQSITAREVKLRSLTADQMDVNSIRVALLTAGVITADMIKADALNGKTITGIKVVGAEINGATLRTADSGSRVEITSVPATDTTPASGRVQLPSGSAAEVEPAAVYSLYDADSNRSTLRLQSAVLRATSTTGSAMKAMASEPTWPSSAITMWSEPDTSYLELVATKAIIEAKSVAIGDAVRSHLVIAGNEIKAENLGGAAPVFIGGMLAVDPDGWISRYNEVWREPTLGSGWAQYGGTWDRVAWKVFPDRTVGLRGVLKRTSKDAVGAGEIVMVLPAAARPKVSYTQQFQVLVSTGAALFLNLAPATGIVTLTNVTAAAATALATGAAHVNLSSIRFPLD